MNAATRSLYAWDGIGHDRCLWSRTGVSVVGAASAAKPGLECTGVDDTVLRGSRRSCTTPAVIAAAPSTTFGVIPAQAGVQRLAGAGEATDPGSRRDDAGSSDSSATLWERLQPRQAPRTDPTLVAAEAAPTALSTNPFDSATPRRTK
jgi:hypothetical protein